MPRPTDTHFLPGSERPQIKGSTLLGPLAANEPVTVAVIVRQKPGSPEVPDLEYWENTPPDQPLEQASDLVRGFPFFPTVK